MPIAITGTGTITGISAGGLPDDCITTAEIAGSAVTPAKLSGAQSGSAPIYGARAWCRFDGRTTGTNAPTAGGNVATVERTATGTYSINFTTPMEDANYCISITCDGPVNGNHCVGFVQTASTSQAGIVFWNTSNSTLRADPIIACVIIFR
jgi:hypothetical protein